MHQKDHLIVHKHLVIVKPFRLPDISFETDGRFILVLHLCMSNDSPSNDDQVMNKCPLSNKRNSLTSSFEQDFLGLFESLPLILCVSSWYSAYLCLVTRFDIPFEEVHRKRFFFN